jgi:hypothetical protein
MSLGQKNIQMTQPLGFFASSTLMLAPGMAAPTYDALGCMWRMMGLGMTAKKVYGSDFSILLLVMRTNSNDTST